MDVRGPIRTIARLDWRRRALIGEALATLAAAAGAIRLLPFRRVLDFGACRLGRGTPPIAPVDVAWAIEGCSRRVPFRALCFEQGLAAQRMMRRRGIDARLHYGLGAGGPRRLDAHVWVSVDGFVVLGGSFGNSFREVAIFPATAH